MALTQKEKKALSAFQAQSRDRLGDGRVEVRLFGSKARGDDRPESDLDVLVIVSREDWRLCDKVYDLATDVLLESGIAISPKVISRKRFGRLLKNNGSFIRNAMRDAVTV